EKAPDETMSLQRSAVRTLGIWARHHSEREERAVVAVAHRTVAPAIVGNESFRGAVQFGQHRRRLQGCASEGHGSPSVRQATRAYRLSSRSKLARPCWECTCARPAAANSCQRLASSARFERARASDSADPSAARYG